MQNLIISFINMVWAMFLDWLYLFTISFSNVDVIWTVLPLWIALIFKEVMTERHGIRMMSAIMNGFILVWAGLDWIRFLMRITIIGKQAVTSILVMKFLISSIVLIMGILIIIAGFRGKRYAKTLGKVRFTCYITIIFTPVIYRLADLNWLTIAVIIIFYPIFHYLINLMDRMVPVIHIPEDETPQSKRTLHMHHQYASPKDIKNVHPRF